MKRILCTAVCLFGFCMTAGAAELAGIFVDDEIKTEAGQTLRLNGLGLREKLWVDVYVGSLYLSKPSRGRCSHLTKAS